MNLFELAKTIGNYNQLLDDNWPQRWPLREGHIHIIKYSDTNYPDSEKNVTIFWTEYKNWKKNNGSTHIPDIWQEVTPEGKVVRSHVFTKQITDKKLIQKHHDKLLKHLTDILESSRSENNE